MYIIIYFIYFYFILKNVKFEKKYTLSRDAIIRFYFNKYRKQKS